MDVKVSWEKELQFRGASASGSTLLMDSHASAETGVSPVEMIALSLASCTAMDVISILGKMRQAVTSFDVKVHADRATDHPRVITRAQMEYIIVGRGVAEAAVLTAIDRSLQKYCPVYSMLRTVFPIDVRYTILEEAVQGEPPLIASGAYPA